MELAFNNENAFEDAISPIREMGAYEALWDQEGASFKTIADKMRSAPGSLPSDLVSEALATEYLAKAFEIADRASVGRFGVRVNYAAEYPKRLQDARHPAELVYYQGWWALADSPSIAIVGSRKASPEGVRRAQRLARELVKANYTVFSGLAEGIDIAAHWAAIEAGGKTVAVIGTPLSHQYPRKHADHQRFIADNHLLISQVPFVRYARQKNPTYNRFFFPERNKVMSALTLATVIVEAGETSGTLIQARAALEQNRKLFILDNCFENPNITWPKRFLEKGAVRVSDFAQITDVLGL